MTGDDFLAQPALDYRLALHERAHAIANDLAYRCIRAGFDFCFDDSRHIMRERDAELLRRSHVRAHPNYAHISREWDGILLEKRADGRGLRATGRSRCESALRIGVGTLTPITIVIERCFYCIFCRWGGVNIGCDRFSSKLQIVSIFKLVAVGSGGVKKFFAA